MSQHILGIRPTLNGLQIDPCIPADWKGFSCVRKYRGAEYHITVRNPEGVEKGIATLLVNGKEVTESCIPVPPEGSVLQVEVIMG